MEKNVLPLLLHALALLLCTRAAMCAPRCGDCGRIPVPYPLSTGPGCGDQSYKVRCNAGTLWFDALSQSSYVITSINPGTRRMIVKPASLLATLASQPISNICHAYIRENVVAAACRSTAKCCWFKAGGPVNAYKIGVRDEGCMAYQSFVNLATSLPVKRWPEPGLEIEWALPQEPICKIPKDCSTLLNSMCLPDGAILGQRRCFCKAGFHWGPINGLCQNLKCEKAKSCKHKKKSRTPLLGGVAVVAAILILVPVGILVCRHRQNLKREAQGSLIKKREDMLNANNSGKMAKIFSGKEIKRATNNFSKDNFIGSGGFSEVFKGILDDGTVTAVKRAKLGNTKGTDQVLNEVRILCQVNHRCLVRLLGCCVELEQPIMIYEYIPTAPSLTISMGTIPESGLHSPGAAASLLPSRLLKALLISTRLPCHPFTIGTLNQLWGCVVGAVNLQEAIDFNREEEDVNLVLYIKKIMKEEKLMDVIDPVLKDGASKVDMESVKALGLLAAACLDERRQSRPSMKEAAEEIEYIISIIEVPKD
ncbi:Wall-associated receptor kinase-like 15 [Vitis vinifera]|uniref:Wall-associated receptor kinase-like 15 n=1 Tax=Vitis vinifera TaxID=29760 RepID=A0A438HSI2_VITVI|nr:Wall-associated receptor kinase-like 15 [Vitis vinifera]